MAKLRSMRVGCNFTIEIAAPDGDRIAYLKPSAEVVLDLEPGDDPNVVREEAKKYVQWCAMLDCLDDALLIRRLTHRAEDFQDFVDFLQSYFDQHPKAPSIPGVVGLDEHPGP